MMNRVLIMGRLVKEVELRHTSTGTPVCSFALACERDYKPKDGERETDFIDCVAWNNEAEFLSRFFTKGRMVAVDGRLEADKYTDRDGNKRKRTVVVARNVYFCDSKKPDGISGQNGNGQYGQTSDSYGDFRDIEDEDGSSETLPF